MKICVTGASGFIGKRLCKHLLACGHETIAMVRSEPQAADAYPEGLSFRTGDVRDSDSLAKVFEGCDAVMHLAALFNHPELTAQDYYDVNVQGVENVLNAAKLANVGRVIHCSTVGVASEGPMPYTEKTAYAPPEWDKYETSKCAGEKLAIQYHKDHNYPVVVIRPAQVYGPGDEGKIKFYRMVKKGVIVNAGKTLKHLIYVDDLCSAFEKAVHIDSGFGEPLIIASPEATPLKELIKIVAATINVPEPKITLPATPITLASWAIEIIFNAMNKKPPVFRRSMNFFTKSVQFDSPRAKEVLGFSAAISTEEGVRETAKWYQEQGFI